MPKTKEDPNPDICALCGHGGEDVRGPRLKGWTGGDAAPNGRFLVTLPGPTYRNKSKDKPFDNGDLFVDGGRFHAFHDIELGETSRKMYDIPHYWPKVMTVGEFAKFVREKAEADKLAIAMRP